MRQLTVRLLIKLLLLFTVFTVNAQRLPFDDSLSSKIKLYGIKTNSPILFIHFDKNVYSNNENVWFTAYLLNCADPIQHKTLSLALVREDDRAVVMEDKFVIKNGIAFGNTFIPDSVGPGNFSFVAVTNRLVDGKPEVLFTQPVIIKTANKPGFTALLSPIDTSAAATQQRVLLEVNFADRPVTPSRKEPPPFAQLSYYIGDNRNAVMRGTAITENDRYSFNIPTKMLNAGSNVLYVKVRYKDEVRNISIALPVPPKPAIVRFYPEGGNMINGMEGVVGCEIKTAARDPIGASAFLYEDGKPIDTLTINSSGLGRFTLTPKAGKNYFVKLYRVNKEDISYQLPTALSSGPALTLAQALVDDILTVTINSDQKEKLLLVGHDYNQLFFSQPVMMSGKSKRITLDITTIPKGLTQLTLTDSTGKPYAQRLFFAHFNLREPILVTSDKAAYTPREKVNVKIKLTSSLPDSGLVSVACVQENRIELKRKNDIESYFYLGYNLGDMPASESYLANSVANKKLLEDILLVKGWRRFSWTDLLRTTPADTFKTYSNVVFKGNVTWFNDKLNKAVMLLNMRQISSSIMTDEAGNFTIDDKMLITEHGKKLQFLVSEKHVNNYQIHLPDPYAKFNTQLADEVEIKTDNKVQPASSYLQLKDNERAIQLKEVNIHDIKDDAFYGEGSNACGDYVCRNNFLNCIMHATEYDNRPPIKGKEYMTMKGLRIIYAGCFIKNPVQGEKRFKGIYEAQEFYPLDFSKESLPIPEYQSTIFWKHLVDVSSLKTTDLTFYTSDITGRFKIVVQGITANDVTYGEANFNVVKAK